MKYQEMNTNDQEEGTVSQKKKKKIVSEWNYANLSGC